MATLLFGKRALTHSIQKTSTRGMSRVHQGLAYFPVFNVFQKVMYHNTMFPQGIIRWETGRCTFSKFEFSGNMVLIGGFIMAYLGCMNLFRDDWLFPKLYMATKWQRWYRFWKYYGIVPDLNDNSYGSWNYYPGTVKGNPRQ